ncbi:hypothetical protein ACRAKI_31790 [Saccharothrix isguenensis]
MTIHHDGTTKSTVDLTTWPLLTLKEAWKADVPSPNVLDVREPTGELAKRYGIDTGGATLVRPDGVLARRTTEGTTLEGPTPAARLTTTLATLTSEPVDPHQH